MIIYIPATPVKSAPSSTSPLGISSSPIVQSPDLPTSSTTGTKRAAANCDILDGDGTDSGKYYRAMYTSSPGPSHLFNITHRKVGGI